MNVLRILFSTLANNGFSRMFDLIIDPNEWPPQWGFDEPPEVGPQYPLLDAMEELNTMEELQEQSTPWLLIAIVAAIAIFAIIMVVRILRKRKAVSD